MRRLLARVWLLARSGLLALGLLANRFLRLALYRLCPFGFLHAGNSRARAVRLFRLRFFRFSLLSCRCLFFFMAII